MGIQLDLNDPAFEETAIASDGHVTVNGVAGYIDSGLLPAEENEVQAHLSTCAECRAQIATVRQLLRDAEAEDDEAQADVLVVDEGLALILAQIEAREATRH